MCVIFFFITLVFADVIFVTIFTRKEIYTCVRSGYVVGPFLDVSEFLMLSIYIYIYIYIYMHNKR